jgi:hypothetical protein
MPARVKQDQDHFRKVAVNKRRRRKPALSRKQRSDVLSIVDSKLAQESEKKYFDAEATDHALNAGVITDLTPVSQGDGVGARDGDEINPLFFQVRAALMAPTVYNSGSSSSQGILYRVLLIQWHPNTAADTPSMADLLENSTNAFSFLNRDYTKQYRVLYENRGVLVNSAGNDDSVQHLDFTIPAKQMRKITFNDSATTGEDHLYLVCMSSEVTTGPRLIYTSRLGFMDA